MAILTTQVVDLRNTALNFQLSYWVESFDLVNQPAFCVYVAKIGNGLRRVFGRVNNSAELDSKDVSSQVRNTALNFRVS